MTATAGQREEARWDLFWAAAPFALLALSTLLATMSATTPWTGRLLTAGVAGLTAGWMWYATRVRPHWLERLGGQLGYVAVLLALTGVLLARSQVYGLHVIGVNVQILGLLPGLWAYGGVAATAILLLVPPAVAAGQRHDPGDYLRAFVVNAVTISAIGLFIRYTSVQSERRRQALAELAEAHTRLADSAQENAELQARLIAQAKRVGVRSERTRLAGEIHDTLAQGLTGIITQLEAAERVVAHSEARRRIGTATTLARESLAEARRSVAALRPEPLVQTQLPDAVAKVADRWAAEHGTAVTVTVTGAAQALHTEVEVTLLRAVQEALTNVARHAGASRVGITLSYMEDIVVLDVRDDGMGFDPADGGGGGFGLVAMRHRLTRLGGSLEVESRPGHGTALSARVTALPVGTDE